MLSAADGDYSRKPASTARGSTVSRICASLVRVGLRRFTYTPLLPAIIETHWFAALQRAPRLPQSCEQ
jgi:hypothetical protein